MVTSGNRDTFNRFAELCIEKQVPFAVWRFPGSETEMIVSRNGKLLYVRTAEELAGQQGFIYAPFHSSTKYPVALIPSDRTVNSHEIPELIRELEAKAPFYPAQESKPPDNVSKEAYIEKVRTARTRLNSDFTKVVLSRPVTVKKPSDYHPGKHFYHLIETYPEASCHLVHLPGEGTWLGASPERLIEKKKDGLHFTSLAGTQPAGSGKDYKWEEKELEEQQIVTEFIRNTLLNEGFRVDVSRETETVRAGRLVHLSTHLRIDGIFSPSVAARLVSLLHPTPAVCGWPREPALNLINKLEGYNRTYYSGFFGWWAQEKLQLFVNLRCMKVFPEHLTLFAGGGITRASNPEKEWEETRLKTETLLITLD